jgi:hypothetical protein
MSCKHHGETAEYWWNRYVESNWERMDAERQRQVLLDQLNSLSKQLADVKRLTNWDRVSPIAKVEYTFKEKIGRY